ncbi:two-component system histidine kinase PnpS [Aerococcaceae bacterium WGS1372]
MIYNHRANQRKYGIILAIVFLILVGGTAILLRYQIDQSILKPLEQRAEIQGYLFEESSINVDNMSDIELLDPLDGKAEQIHSESALLSNGSILWSNFSDSSDLRVIRQAIGNLGRDEEYSQSVNKDYVVIVPITIDGQRHQLIKAYDKSQFRTQLNYFYILLAFAAIIYLLCIWLIYKLIYQTVAEPINYITESVEQLASQNYSYEYIPGQSKLIDNLGQSVDALKEKLRARGMELDSSEQKLSLLLGHLNLGVVLINHSGKIELINHEAVQLLNIDTSATQRSFQAVIKSYVLIDMINDALETHRPLSNDIEMYVPTSKYIDVNIIPFGKSGEEAESILLLLYDISQIRRLEKVRTEFVANASHELRTPVTAIKGFAETLMDGALETPELAEKFVSIIANESNRLELIINDILELSRVEKQSEPFMLKNFELVGVVENLLNFFYNRASMKDIRMTIEASTAIQMMTDQHRVEQIFTNLIDNAINYSDSGSEITIRIDKMDDYVHFSVADNGMGIPEADQERIFERFYRVDKGRSRNSGGTGLGLSIVRNLVRNMSGTIYVESEVGKGSVFHVELPLTQNN